VEVRHELLTYFSLRLPNLNFYDVGNHRQLQSDGTGNGGKDITGLVLLLKMGRYSPHWWNNSSTPYWRNQWISDVQLDPTTTPPFRAYIDALRTLYNSCSRG